MADTMKAILIDQYGPAHVMRLGQADIPQPGPDQVLIRCAYASVNPADWKIRSGMLSHVASDPFPMILGMDCSGVVAGVGSNVTDFKPGDRVTAMSGVGLGIGARGTYAEYCCTPAVRAAHIPDHLSLAEAATIPVAAASGGGAALEVAHVQPGHKVFVNGGSGSLGTFAVQFLRVLGASVAATSSTAHVERLIQLGVDRVIDYSKENVLDALRAWAPDGVDSIIDAVGLETLPRNTPDCIKPGGTLVCISNLITDTDYFDIESATKRNVRVADNVRGSASANTPLFQMEGFHRIVAGVSRGDIKVPPYKILPLTEVAKAHEEVESGHFRHKIVLQIADL